jgi:hypothetical protein
MSTVLGRSYFQALPAPLFHSLLIGIFDASSAARLTVRISRILATWERPGRCKSKCGWFRGNDVCVSDFINFLKLAYHFLGFHDFLSANMYTLMKLH